MRFRARRRSATRLTDKALYENRFAKPPRTDLTQSKGARSRQRTARARRASLVVVPPIFGAVVRRVARACDGRRVRCDIKTREKRARFDSIIQDAEHAEATVALRALEHVDVECPA